MDRHGGVHRYETLQQEGLGKKKVLGGDSVRARDYTNVTPDQIANALLISGKNTAPQKNQQSHIRCNV